MQWQKPCFVQWSNWNKECTSEKAFVLLCAPLFIRSTSLASHKNDTIANSIQLISFDRVGTLWFERANEQLEIFRFVVVFCCCCCRWFLFRFYCILRVQHSSLSSINLFNFKYTTQIYLYIEHLRSLVKKCFANKWNNSASQVILFNCKSNMHTRFRVY